jgi:hypothetical protein
MIRTLIIFGLLTGLAHADDYNRSKHFGSSWIDEDKDCQNTRQEVLIAESLMPVTLSEDGCKVLTGVWICRFTGKVFIVPIKLDIDHLVPLKEAWLSGADQWTKEQRVAYANDMNNPDHLVAVALGANRSKGAKDPAEWMPTKNRTWYAIEWLRVKLNYGLTFDKAEGKAITSELP